MAGRAPHSGAVGARSRDAGRRGRAPGRRWRRRRGARTRQASRSARGVRQSARGSLGSAGCSWSWWRPRSASALPGPCPAGPVGVRPRWGGHEREVRIAPGDVDFAPARSAVGSGLVPVHCGRFGRGRVLREALGCGGIVGVRPCGRRGCGFAGQWRDGSGRRMAEGLGGECPGTRLPVLARAGLPSVWCDCRMGVRSVGDGRGLRAGRGAGGRRHCLRTRAIASVEPVGAGAESGFGDGLAGAVTGSSPGSGWAALMTLGQFGEWWPSRDARRLRSPAGCPEPSSGPGLRVLRPCGRRRRCPDRCDAVLADRRRGFVGVVCGVGRGGYAVVLRPCRGSVAGRARRARVRNLAVRVPAPVPSVLMRRYGTGAVPVPVRRRCGRRSVPP